MDDIEPITASLIMSLESVFAVIAGVVILREHLSLRELIGCVIMFTATVIVQLSGDKKDNYLSYESEAS